MCTYNIHIDDNKASMLQTQFKNDNAVQLWMQHQIDMLVSQQIASMISETKKHTNNCDHHDSLSGMTPTDLSCKDLTDEHITEDYDLTSFEESSFVKECVDAFDDNVSKIEKEYATASQSA